MGKNYLDFEEEYHGEGSKRTNRQERKRIQQRDRSKYKKSDQDKVNATAPPEGHGYCEGRILEIHGETATLIHQGQLYESTVKGTLKKQKGLMRNLITVGDIVLFEPKENELSPIVHVKERKSILSRREHFKGLKEQLLAANIDQVFLVSALFEPILKPTLIDRYIIAARKGHIEPIIVINKCDYLDNPPTSPDSDIAKEIAHYEAICATCALLNIPLIKASVHSKFGLDEIKERMKGKASVFSGQSGVGKTSLVNAITGLDLTVGDVVSKTRKGSHTTSSAQLIPLENESFIIDTPGIRSFGIWDLSVADIQDYFSEIGELSFSCKYPNCTHLHEPGCAVCEAVEKGEIPEMRYQSYVALMTEE